ncbi:SCO2521 family protein [Actinoplanes sp. N902-109]|uniref:SCO2521 family protein n=1 Tax=Actinoplanes sp. (strain N902-109) TaxID=649831 RepID=UPI0003295B5C|nr:SCO2521 family protein [Actinoplanes sp. N902-109]AGL18319.1 hypothetical protein L083_4809 [Actinoplanes sp. N902-109]
MLTMGEVHTGLLRGAVPVMSEDARGLVDLVAGEPVLWSERPIGYASSPVVPVGVDCMLNPAGIARRVRGIGTVLHRAAITAGQVVQGSAYAAVVPAGSSTRQPWSYYMSQPGVVEVTGRIRWPDLAVDLARHTRSGLDAGAVAARALDRVQDGVQAAGPPRLRSGRTRLRWVADTSDGDVRVRFELGADDRRVIRLTVPVLEPGRLAALCEDVALHDWLLTTLIETVRKAAIGVLPRDEVLLRLSPAIDCLLHLWMPDSRGDDLTAQVWSVLEARPGFSRQWQTLVHRIRDQLSAGAVAAAAAVSGQ